MYLAYFDESGDSGIVNSPTRFFVLSCVLVHHSQWMDNLDSLIDLRRRMRLQVGIPSRSELKAIDIRKGRGPLWGLRWSLDRRMVFFRNVLRNVAAGLPSVHIFSVAIDKIPAHERGQEPRATAWEYALQRVHRFCDDGDHPVMIFPDEGHGVLIKRLIRKMRRHQRVPSRFGNSSRSVPLHRVIEDPNDRHSHDSYFIQLADWCAYAAHRSKYIDPQEAVADDLWDILHDRLVLQVNALAGGPPGIKLHPATEAGVVF